MARSRPVQAAGDEHGDVIRWYRKKLEAPAVFPWKGSAYEPVRIGPTWQTDGRHWVLPELTIGWDVLGFAGTWLQHSAGKPWRYTLEQARFLLWWYALDDSGRFLYHDGVLQRLKGWGKDPLGAGICSTEMLGPCRVADMDASGPVATDLDDAWVQTAAVSLEQTKNTMRLFPRLFTPAAKRFFGLQVGKEMVHGMGDERLIQAVTSSPTTLEGARATFVLRNETHHWHASNDGHEMDAVIERNATKSADGASRALSITNAYDPAEDSVAQRAREAVDLAASGASRTTGILYDSLEAPPDAPLEAEHVAEVVSAIRGDSKWLDVDRIVKSILDTRNPPSRSRRFWFNQINASEDSWLAPVEWAACTRADAVVADRDIITVGFDGSRKRARGVTDATALVGCRVSDGHLFEIEVWEQPQGRTDWQVPATEVDLTVHRIFDTYNVVGFYADPAKWESYVASWEAKYHTRLKVKASRDHPMEWWMTGGRSTSTVRALQQFHDAVLDGELTHDGAYHLSRHVLNAHRRPSRAGMQIGKEHPDSSKKIDAAVAAVLAWQARLDALAAGVGETKPAFTPRRVR